MDAEALALSSDYYIYTWLTLDTEHSRRRNKTPVAFSCSASAYPLTLPARRKEESELLGERIFTIITVITLVKDRLGEGDVS